MDPVHMEHGSTRRRRLLRLSFATVTTGAGTAAAVIGLALVAVRGPVAMYAAPGTLHVGGSVLTVVSGTSTTTLYDGDAAYQLTQRPDGSTVGVSAWTDGRVHNSAVCAMRRQSTVLLETCQFTVGGTRTTSVDTYDLDAAGTWHRTYADGEQVSIAVPGGDTVVPVAFPIGR